MSAPALLDSAPGTCVRKAWLNLGGTQSVQLDAPNLGYLCTSLDLGAPAVREVTYNLPDQDGMVDLTQYLGGRIVTATITALVGAGCQSIDYVAAMFAPYMLPNVRPVLHYVLDRPGAPERTLVLRGASGGYQAPIVGANERDIQLSWLAADPIARDPVTQYAYAWAGSVVSGGRTYPLTFDRTYPGGGGAVVNANVATPGDVAVRPLLQLYGPITGPRITLTSQVTGQVWHLNFVSSFRVDALHRVDIDCAAHTAFLDGNRQASVLGSLDWSSVVAGWPMVPALPDYCVLNLAGSSTNNITQCVAVWNDGYLT